MDLLEQNSSLQKEHSQRASGGSRCGSCRGAKGSYRVLPELFDVGDEDSASHFGCLKGVSKSIQVLLNGIRAVVELFLDTSEIASPV